MRKTKRFLWLVGLLMFLLVGCASTTVEPTIEVTPFTGAALVPTNTETAVPTATRIPPTATVAPPDILSSFLENIEVVAFYDFNRNDGWDVHCACVFSGGEFVMNSRNWNAAVWRKNSIAAGEGIVLDFVFSEKVQFEVLFDIGEWDTNQYRRFGIYINDNVAGANLWAGTQLFHGRLGGNFSLKPGTQYSMTMAVIEGGEFLAVIWDPTDPTKFISTHERIGESWAGRDWKFSIGGNQGRVNVDNLRMISFGDN
ncbi:MAG: hypothetical protein KIT46_01595 [Anaerolineales bacterium]|nr:hypothetical protein [Anaerolineales bacterium]MCW5854718.1 hypothetical protein [Anaerolineales bacterium]